MLWTNALILEFIKLYEQEPVIWNPKYGAQRPGRLEISDAWHRIEANFSVECPIEELKRKKDSLMATYRSLRNKIKQKEIDSGGSEDTYKPNWFAYEAMFNFLGDVYQPKISPQQQDLEDMHMEEDPEDMENSVGDDYLLDADDISDLILNQGTSIKLPQDRQNRKRKEPNINTCMCENMTRDECSLYSQLLAKKLRVFDDHTRMILMHEIDSYVFRAKLEQKQKGFIDPNLIRGINSNVLEDYNNTQGVTGFVTETIVVENATGLATDAGEMATVLVKSEMH